MVGDSAVLDYLRANDPGCTLASHGEDLVSDTFAISMGKGFPLRVSELFFSLTLKSYENRFYFLIFINITFIASIYY